MITLTVNGQQRQISEPMTVRRLLEHVAITHAFVAVARNGDVLHQDEYDRIVVQDGDTLEIVRMVGGGASEGNVEPGPRRRALLRCSLFHVPSS